MDREAVEELGLDVLLAKGQIGGEVGSAFKDDE